MKGICLNIEPYLRNERNHVVDWVKQIYTSQNEVYHLVNLTATEKNVFIE